MILYTFFLSCLIDISRDGATRCGLYCAAVYLIEKMRYDKEVDVFVAVRNISSTNPRYVASLVSVLLNKAEKCFNRVGLHAWNY